MRSTTSAHIAPVARHRYRCAATSAAIACAALTGCSSTGDLVVPESKREQDPTDIPAIVSPLPPGTNVEESDLRLVGTDSRGNLWFVGQSEPGGDLCLVLQPVVESKWVAGCSTGPMIEVSSHGVGGVYDLASKPSGSGEWIGDHLRVWGV